MFYDFRCRTCGYEEEKQYLISELPSQLPCPHCNSQEFKQSFGNKSKTLAVQIPSYMRAGSPLADRKRDYNGKGSSIDNILDATGQT